MSLGLGSHTKWKENKWQFLFPIATICVSSKAPSRRRKAGSFIGFISAYSRGVWKTYPANTSEGVSYSKGIEVSGLMAYKSTGRTCRVFHYGPLCHRITLGVETFNRCRRRRPRRSFFSLFLHRHLSFPHSSFTHDEKLSSKLPRCRERNHEKRLREMRVFKNVNVKSLSRNIHQILNARCADV